jgi:long-subunit fatty acid transport protein
VNANRKFSKTLVFLSFLVLGKAAQASDAWYYKNLLVGERASGLGGAFAAIADDPSGVWYNPAGLVMGRESYLSGSVNAFQTSSIQYQDLFPGENYSYNSQGLIPSFFGFTQELSPRAKAGFLLMVRDSLSQEQDDELTGLEVNGISLTSITRQLVRSRDSYVVGPGLSYQVAPRLMVGLSAFAIYQNERFIDQQRALYIDSNDATKNLYQLNMTYLSREAWGLMPKLGVLYVPHPRFSIGLTAAKTVHLAGKGKAKLVGTKIVDGAIPAPTGNFSDDYNALTFSNVRSRVLSPWEFSGALAWFPSDSWTFSSQVDYQTDQSDFQYLVKPTVNLSVGGEWAGFPQLPFRFGFFTNSSNTPAVSSSASDQKEHVDQMGVSGGVSLVSPGSSISFSGSYQFGTGKGQIISGSTAVQEVAVGALTLFISGSYQL